jgi:hypothetical protein
MSRALVLVGHGSSRNPGTRKPICALVNEIRRRGLFDEVRCGLWKEEPHVSITLDRVVSDEITVVPFFIADGYYTRDGFVGEGLYEGSDYEAYAGFGRVAQGALFVELGPFYRWNRFERTGLTRPDFQVPDDYEAYGGRIYIEQANVQMDRRLGMPQEGFVLTLAGEREWNNSDGQIGRTGFASSLPNAVWRARGRLEWYVPSSDATTWEIFATGGWQDELDRVRNTEGQKPLGYIWADAQIRLRVQLGDSFTVTPYVHGQFSKVDSQEPSAKGDEFFFGGGVESYLHLTDALALHAY